VICTEMGCDGGMVCTGLFYVQGWNLWQTKTSLCSEE
jgi:hypothetical protein